MRIIIQNLIAILNQFPFRKLLETGQQENSMRIADVIQKSDQIHFEIAEQNEVIKKMYYA